MKESSPLVKFTFGVKRNVPSPLSATVPFWPWVKELIVSACPSGSRSFSNTEIGVMTAPGRPEKLSLKATGMSFTGVTLRVTVAAVDCDRLSFMMNWKVAYGVPFAFGGGTKMSFFAAFATVAGALVIRSPRLTPSVV